VLLMREFLNFINTKENSYYIIKDTKLYNPLYELVKKFDNRFKEKGPDYEQTKVTSFALLLKMLASGGDTVREVRDYIKDVLTTDINAEFNESVEDEIDNLRDGFEENEITSTSGFRQVIESVTPEIREINEQYVKVRNRQNRGRNVENFIGN